MKKWLIFGILVIVHSFLSFYSWCALFGMGHMWPPDVPKVRQFVWECVIWITWQPLLFPVCYHVRVGDHRLVDLYFIPSVLLNSIAAIGLGYLVFFAIRRLRRKIAHRKTQQSLELTSVR